MSALLLAAFLAAAPGGATPAGPSTRFALHASKALIASLDGPQALDDAIVVVKDGKIERVVAAREFAPEAGLDVLDVRPNWVAPGFVDLHSHVGGNGGDINDMVLQLNTGLRVSPTVVPENEELQRAAAAGVTTILYIPGSGTNIGGAGILLKTALPTFEGMRVRDPGSLKIAQGDNPTRWGYGMGRGMMNYHIRTELARGMGYAKRRAAKEAGHARDIRFDVFDDLLAKRTQVSTHTQIYALVSYTLQIIRREFGIDVYIDHGEWKGYLATEEALELGVAAICGPREIDAPGGRSMDYDGRITGIAGEYQRRGMKLVGFNTDAPVVPQDELFLQASMGTRYGFDGREMQGVRGLTIVPAKVAGIDARVGSLEAGKDADLIVVSGDPLDPRSRIERVFIEGRLVHEAEPARAARSSFGAPTALDSSRRR
ncbi:MAG: amidohydrolase family protein [Planctomycetes bacterium]|nr:amidohydrolase family protein [Planctomycetota bacterium]